MDAKQPRTRPIAARPRLSPTVLMMLLWLALAIPVYSQCNILTTTGSVGGNTAIRLRIFSGSSAAAGPCVVSMSSNASCAVLAVGGGACTNPVNCQALYAYATGVTTNPQPHSCGFNCVGCGQQIIDNSNGLPVELMGFGIEGSEFEDDARSDAETEDSETDRNDQSD